MNTILLLLLNLQLIYGTTFNSTSSVYSRDPDVPTSGYRIGYTTSYGNGFEHNSTKPSGRSRKVVIRHDDNHIDTGRDDDWNPEWNYYHGSVLGFGYDERWYYKDGDDMYFWNGYDWEHIGRWDWVHTHDPSEAYPSVPIDDPPFIIIIGLLFLWMAYDVIIKLMIKKDKK